MNKHDHELGLTAALMTNPVYTRRFDEFCGWFSRENTEHILGDKVSIKAQLCEKSPYFLIGKIKHRILSAILFLGS